MTVVSCACSEMAVIESKLTDLSETLEHLQLPATPADVCYINCVSVCLSVCLSACVCLCDVCYFCCVSLVSVKAVRNQMVRPCVEWWVESDNHTFFQLLSKHDVSPCLATVCAIPLETDAKKILTASPPWRTGGDHQYALVLHGWRLSNKTWNPTTSAWMKQLTWFRFVHCGDWCLHLALYTVSGACQKWWL